MKRQLVAGVMGLALAGCAHTRSDVPKKPDATTPASPVGMNPVPSIHDTINRGTGDSALAQHVLNDPKDPRWSGQAPIPDAIQPGASATPAPGQPASSALMAGAGLPPTGRPGGSAVIGSAPSSQPGGSAIIGSASGGPPGGSPVAGNPSAEPLDRLNPSPPMDVAAAAAAATMPGGAAAVAGGLPSPGNPPTQDPAGLTPSMPPGSGATPPAVTATGAAGAAPGSSILSTLERPGGPMPDMLARPGGPAGSSPTTPADAVGTAGASPGGPPVSDPNGPPVAGPTANGLEPVGAPPSTPAGTAPSAGTAGATVDPSVNTSAAPGGQAKPAVAGKPRPASDPLLGPNPGLMPDLPPLPDTTPAASPAAAKPPAPSSTGSPAAPPASPVDDPPPLGSPAVPADASTAPAPAADAAAPSPAGPPSAPPSLGPPSADNRPVGSGHSAGAAELADLPPLAPVPSSGQVSGGVVQQTVASTAAPVPVRRATAHRDGQVQRVSLQKSSPENQGPEIRPSWRQASMTAAKVGDEIITVRDMRLALVETCKRKNIPYDQLSHEQKNALCAGLLKQMITESLLLQEAKRVIKNPKMYDQFSEEADRYWRDEQIPQLETEFAAENEQQLREKLKEHGRSYEALCQISRRNWMAENFLHAKLKDRLKVDYPDLRKYYNDHMQDREYDRPAQIVWRELLVEVAHYPNREAARRKIESLQQSLQRGADFAMLAKTQSEGPARSREQGGLMQTSPGSYGVAAVNDTLQSLSIGQISGILEGPSSFHIVRVEGRRAAGPAPFEELQDQIRAVLMEKKYQTERTAYIQKVWDETPVTTYLDDSENDPRRVSR
jgi:parvulin-like peptidyl-prolyl isomerase